MNKKLLIIKNKSTEGPGILEPVIRKSGIDFIIVDLEKKEKAPSLDDVKAVVILGGPDSANDRNNKINSELVLIREILTNGIPYLGICLGMQLMVKAAGGEVVKSPVKEIGFRDPEDNLFNIKLTEAGMEDPLFAGLVSTLRVFHLHGETVKMTDKISLLAYGDYCLNQAVRAGRNAYGIQSHFELTANLLESWMTTDADLKLFDKKALKRDFNLISKEYRQTGETLMTNFLRISGFDLSTLSNFNQA